MAILNGTSFRLYFGGDKLVGETSSGISFNNSLVEATTQVTDSFAEYIPGVKSATINFENLYSFDTIEVGDTMVFHIGERLNGYEGNCIVESIEVNTSADEVITHSGSVKVVGELRKFVPIYEFRDLQDRSGVNIQTRAGEDIQINVLTN